MMPLRTIIQPISIARPIGRVIVAGNQTITRVGINPDSPLSWNRRATSWPKNKVSIVTVWRIKAGTHSSKCSGITMIKIDLPP